MSITPEQLRQLLELTRQVFSGTVTRAELSRRSSREQAFVGTAIMLAVPQNYLDGMNVMGIYSRALETLLSAGTVNFLAREGDHMSGSTLVNATRSAGLYRPTPGRGGYKTIVLTPPFELVELVQELGHTSAITAFLQDSAAGVEQARLWREEFDRTTAEENALWNRRRHMEDAVRGTEALYGEEGLRELISKIQERLGD
jgi:hypothetical protein